MPRLPPLLRGRPQNLWPLVSVILYWVSIGHLGALTPDHWIMGSLILGLYYLNPRSRRFLAFILPFLLTAIVYDSQRHFADLIRGPIHVREPYEFDRRFFGIGDLQLTPNEWWQLHLHPALDLLTGFAYLAFIGAFIAISAWLVYRKPPSKLALRMPWAFFALNLLGYSTYYWYAASPPWYVARYGLGPARLDIQASSAGCARFDELLGTHFFSEMYGRAADIHGAIPSLHVAYPLLAFLFAVRLRRLRLVCAFYYLLMCFSAVYLNHHYILDILWGSVYACLIGAIALFLPVPGSSNSPLIPLRPNNLVMFGRSQITSFSSTIVDYTVLYLLNEVLHFWYLVGVASGALLGAITSFILNRHWSFEAGGGNLQRQALRYVQVAALSFGLNVGGVYAVTEICRVHYAFSVLAVSLVVGFLVNYPLYRFYVYRLPAVVETL